MTLLHFFKVFIFRIKIPEHKKNCTLLFYLLLTVKWFLESGTISIDFALTVHSLYLWFYLRDAVSEFSAKNYIQRFTSVLQLGFIFSEHCYNESLDCQVTHKTLLISECAFNIGSTMCPKYNKKTVFSGKCIQSSNPDAISL